MLVKMKTSIHSTCVSLVLVSKSSEGMEQARNMYDHDQSRLMLEALEAPLADSRAAAVNIRLISCLSAKNRILLADT